MVNPDHAARGLYHFRFDRIGSWFEHNIFRKPDHQAATAFGCGGISGIFARIFGFAPCAAGLPIAEKPSLSNATSPRRPIRWWCKACKAKESVGATNGDGFGLGWYGDREEPGLYREVRPAWSDENLKHLCRHISSPLFFAHVRAATGTPTTRPNCHPFVHGRWMFMHNGQIGDWSLIRRRVEELIPDEFYKSRIGTTDSEAVFLAILGAGADADPIAATMRTLATLTELVSTSGTTEPLRFTAALADGRNLYAFRYAYGGSANTLYYRETGGNVVVVSEPLDMERDFWKPVPPGHLIAARAGKPVLLEPLPEVPLSPRNSAAQLRARVDQRLDVRPPRPVTGSQYGNGLVGAVAGGEMSRKPLPVCSRINNRQPYTIVVCPPSRVPPRPARQTQPTSARSSSFPRKSLSHRSASTKAPGSLSATLLTSSTSLFADRSRQTSARPAAAAFC